MVENEISVNVGDIFHHSWGYDQTNSDFYQVVKRTPKGVHLRRLNATSRGVGPMQEMVKPIPNSFSTGWNSGVLKRRLCFHKDFRGNDTVSVNINNCGYCDLWDGDETYASHTH